MLNGTTTFREVSLIMLLQACSITRTISPSGHGLMFSIWCGWSTEVPASWLMKWILIISSILYQCGECIYFLLCTNTISVGLSSSDCRIEWILKLPSKSGVLSRSFSFMVDLIPQTLKLKRKCYNTLQTWIKEFLTFVVVYGVPTRLHKLICHVSVLDIYRCFDFWLSI